MTVEKNMAITVDRRIWFGVFGGPAAWTLAFIVAYAIESRACVAGNQAVARWSVLLAAVFALVVSIAASLTSYHRWHHRHEHRQFLSGARADDVRAYLAWSGTVTSGLAALGSLYLLITPLFLRCTSAW